MFQRCKPNLLSQVERQEEVRIILHGQAEFEASNVVLTGSHTFEVHTPPSKRYHGTWSQSSPLKLVFDLMGFLSGRYRPKLTNVNGRRCLMATRWW